MKFRAILLCGLGCVAMLALSRPLVSAESVDDDATISSLIVERLPGRSSLAARAMVENLTDLDTSSGSRLGGRFETIVLDQPITTEQAEELARSLEDDGLVVSASPDYPRFAATPPNDPEWPSQWSLQPYNGTVNAGIGLEAAWNSVNGNSLGFTPVSPARVLDTRDGTGGVPTTRIGNFTGTAPDLSFTITGTGGIPTTGVAAVSLNVTVANTNAPDEGGYVTVYPCNTGRPPVSNLNFTNGQITPNAVIVPVGNGNICFHVYGTAHLIVDINGWYPENSSFTPVSPARVLDTRNGTGGVPTTRIGNFTGTAPDLSFTITGTGGIPTTGVAAVSLNVTVANTNAPDEGGYVTVYPCNTGRPPVSNLNFTNGQITPNAVIVPVGNGNICFHVYGTAHLIVDINGWYPRVKDVVVAVIDTGRPMFNGIDHPDMIGRVVDGYDLMSVSVPRDPRDGDGWDADETDNGDWETPGQCGSGSGASHSSWHGAHVAGIIGARSNNGVGIAGIGLRTKVQHVRVLGSCGGTTSDVVVAIRWAAGLVVSGLPANPTPADVINLSLGGPGTCSESEQSAINAAVEAGSIVVVAAGNNGANLGQVNVSPANCDNVITVAGTESNGSRLLASNFGSKVEIAAPGRNIYSTVIDSQTSPVANWWYQNKTGTSMSAPAVAGVISLMLNNDGTLTNQEVLGILQTTASPFPVGSTCSSNVVNTSYCGAGILHAGAALQAVQDDGTTRAMTPVSPARVLDTRNGTGGVPTTRIGNFTGTAPDL
ncbi:MAG: S8 family serine peptidase, partial [Actinobacteria bacterium]|nr:S8 family serine peptidase [Actinomycetota bacterium]